MEDFTTDDLNQQLGDVFDGAGQHRDDPNWSVRPKGEDAGKLSRDDLATVADLEGETDAAAEEAALGEAFDKATTGAAARADRLEKLRKTVDEFISPYRTELAEKGMGRTGAIRQVFLAEQALRQRPAEALPALIDAYGGSLDEAGRLAVAREVMIRLGVPSESALADAERARLAHFERQAQTMQEATRTAAKSAAQRIEAFAQGKPDFTALRPVMAALLQADEARDLASAYDAARRFKGLQPHAEAAAQAEAEARRSKAAQAQNARTPRSRGVHVAEGEVEEDTAKIMSDVYDRIMADGR